MKYDPNINIGSTLTNRELTEMFKCGIQGGMRRSRKTNSLVLITDHTRGIYEDRWEDDVLHYTGMGKEGDQSIESAQNKTLRESENNGVTLFLFEVFEQGRYIFLGNVKLVDAPYQERQPDKNGRLRNVWIFPLRILDDGIGISSEMIERYETKKRRKIKEISSSELNSRVNNDKSFVSKRRVKTIVYQRNQYISEFVKRRAHGRCELCEKEAPFNDLDNDPFLECHHIVWLSEGGKDTSDNCVALCPNCHRKMHILNSTEDRERLRLKAKSL